MKKLFWVIAIVIIACSCRENKEAPKIAQPVVISGNVQLRDSLILEKITIYGFDMWTKLPFQQDAIINDQGDFTTTIDFTRANTLTFYGNNSFQILAIPGDSITVNYTESKDPDAFKNSIKFSGKTATTQNKLQAYLNGNPLKTDPFFEEGNQLDYHDLEKFIEENVKNIQDYYSMFLNDKTVNKFLKDYINADKKFATLNIKMDYASYANYYGKGTPEVNSSYYEDLNNLPKLEKQDLINTTAVNNLLYNNHSFDSKEIEQKAPQATSIEIDQTIIETAMKKDSYLNQHTIAMLIMRDLNDHSTKLYENNASNMDDYFTDPDLLPFMEQQYFKTKDLLEKPQIPSEAQLLTFQSDDASKFIAEIVSNAKGKVIYIDHWATWCGPCKAEFKEASPALHEKFKEEVEFIYLCHESKENGYIPSIAEFKIKGKHYFLTTKQGRIVQKQIELEGFPTYTIFDKKGNQVLSDYIHRPSYGPTSAILSKLINEKEVNLKNTLSNYNE
jgi:thiol-disulfide isomerase/thioredoxin